MMQHMHLGYASDLMRCSHLKFSMSCCGDEGHDESTNARIWRGTAGMARMKKCCWPSDIVHVSLQHYILKTSNRAPIACFIICIL